MRSIAIVSFAAASALVAAPALAEAGAKLTRDQIICKMTGDCGAQQLSAESGKLDKPAEAGFTFHYATKAAPVPTASKSVPVAAPVRHSANAYTRTAPAAPAAGHRKAAVTNSLSIPINFARGSADLSGEARTQVIEFAAALQSPQMAGRNVVIEGHTDSRGDHAMNLDLSQRRARAVADFLVTQKVDVNRVKSVGYGPDRPLANHNASAPANRRVQFSLAE